MASRNRTTQALDAVALFQQVHAEVWNLLPWYVNGTLDEDERREVERHLPQCLICRTEVAEQGEIARCAAETDVLDSVMETSLAKMHERLAAEDAPSPPVSGAPARTGAWPARRSPIGRRSTLWDRIWRAVRLRPAAIGVLGGVPAMAIAALLVFGPAADPPAPFATLSDGEVSVDGPMLRVKVDETADAAAFQALVDDNGLAVVDGPSPTGVYTLTLADGDPVRAEAAMERLREADLVEFITLVDP